LNDLIFMAWPMVLGALLIKRVKVYRNRPYRGQYRVTFYFYAPLILHCWDKFFAVLAPPPPRELFAADTNNSADPNRVQIYDFGAFQGHASGSTPWKSRAWGPGAGTEAALASLQRAILGDSLETDYL
jgi:hypothetical protein